MKKLLYLTVIVLLISLLPIQCYADESIDNAIDDSLSHLNFSGFSEINEDYGNIVERVQSVMNGDFDSASDFFQMVINLVSPELSSLLPSLISVVVIAILCSIVTSGGSSFISKGTSNVIYFVAFSAVVSTLMVGIYGIYDYVTTLLANISKTIDVSTPIFLTLMVANGAVTTAKIYQPTVLMLSTTVIKLISNYILPLCCFAMVFGIISNVSKAVRVDKMSKTANSIASWMLGVSFMIFFAFLSVQGATAMSIDGVSIRAAKFATKNYIPLLGGYLSDGFDVIMASTTLIKNSFGLVVLIMMFSMAIVPLVSILLYKLSLSLVTSIAQPVLDDRFVKLFSGISDNLTMVLVVIIAVMFMFFLVIMLAIMTANGV